MSDIFINNYTGQRATNRGTSIIKPGQDMDKNAFLKILSAELSNLDPMGNNDSTQYVTQLAQFASMEQMTNLNSTMSDSAAYGLVGRGVTLNQYDSKGAPYTGVVHAVTSSNGSYTLSVEVNVDGKNEYKDFSIDNILTVLEVPDYSIPPLNSMNGNMSMLLASSFIGKHVELSEQNEDKENITGKVLSVAKKDGVVMVKLKVDGTDETKEYAYDKVINVSETPLKENDIETDSE